MVRISRVWNHQKAAHLCEFAMKDRNMPVNSVRRCIIAGAIAMVTSVVSAPLVQAQVFSALRQAIAEAAAPDEGLSAFYRERDFQPIWTTTEAADRRNALMMALEQAGDHGLPVSRYDPEVLREAFRTADNPYARGQADVLASRMFMSYANDVHSGFLDPSRIIPDIFQELPRQEPQDLLAAFLESTPRTFMASLPPQSPAYTRLMRRKLELEALAGEGGFGPTVQVGSLRPGDTGYGVVQLRNRLMALGYLGRSATAEYDATLQAAVAMFQSDNGIEADGIAGNATIQAVNRSLESHWNEIVLAMERARWLNDGQIHDRLIFVNLADFHTRVVDNGEVTFITRSVIGSRDRQTPEFSDEMEHMVINPSWWLPWSIARGYIPAIMSGGANHLQLMRGGEVIPRASVNWGVVSASNFPFEIRQPPGPSNALGTVKFMFPNRHAIYLHDSPAQHLMTHTVRAYSAGCVRLDDPHEFAYHLLERQVEDPVNYFQSILRTGQETQVNLEVHLPVHLTYQTAWIESDGRTRFRPDVYGRNARLSQAVRAAGVVMPPPAS
jgi:murein L,D-transpeptidase YcbB/YkuD